MELLARGERHNAQCACFATTAELDGVRSDAQLSSGATRSAAISRCAPVITPGSLYMVAPSTRQDDETLTPQPQRPCGRGVPP
eukprot:scaffold15486_cov111-Isochrysis_galbana.AAC.11